MNEDDTFRVLSRNPIDQVYKTILRNFDADTTKREFVRMVVQSGYTLEEFDEYEEFYLS